MAESEPKPGSFWSGWTAFAAGSAALLTAVGGLIAGLAAAGIIGGGGEGNAQPIAPATTAPSTTARSTFVTFTPTPEEQRLLRVVPTDIQPDCERPAEDDYIFQAAVSVVCDVPALDGGFARFALFDSEAQLDNYMDERRTLGDASQRCGSRSSGSVVYRDSAGQPMGLLVCYVDEVGAWIEWSNVPALVYGIAHQPDGDSNTLYDFWARVGPTNP